MGTDRQGDLVVNFTGLVVGVLIVLGFWRKTRGRDRWGWTVGDGQGRN